MQLKSSVLYLILFLLEYPTVTHCSLTQDHHSLTFLKSWRKLTLGPKQTLQLKESPKKMKRTTTRRCSRTQSRKKQSEHGECHKSLTQPAVTGALRLLACSYGKANTLVLILPVHHRCPPFDREASYVSHIHPVHNTIFKYLLPARVVVCKRGVMWCPPHKPQLPPIPILRGHEVKSAI